MSITSPENGLRVPILRNDRFESLTEPYRRELRVHCYRMLGSLHEAEDLVQETYVKAWRAFDSLQQGSVRAWLYRIATNACLNALASRKQRKRLLPDQIGPSTTGFPEGSPAREVYWLEPIPDSYLENIADDASNPEARYVARETVQLAFMAAIQHLPPRQRVVLLLCEVLDWSAAEAASLLGGTTASINSALQRARKKLSGSPVYGSSIGVLDTESQTLLDRYMVTWQSHDLEGFVALLKEDALFEMPPYLQWYSGRDTIRDFFEVAWQHCQGLRMIPTSANGQPAFAVYSHSAGETEYKPDALHVLSISDGRIERLTSFLVDGDSALFTLFGLPLTIQ